MEYTCDGVQEHYSKSSDWMHYDWHCDQRIVNVVSYKLDVFVHAVAPWLDNHKCIEQLPEDVQWT